MLYILNSPIVEYLSQHIEALLFSAEQPITVPEIGACLEEVFGLALMAEDITGRIEDLGERYRTGPYAFELVQSGSGYQFLTKPAYHETLNIFLKNKTQKKLSRASLETLSIIAYKQPVSKLELERVRGVNCDYALQKLLEKELINISGRSEGPGRPLIYITGEKFLQYFGIQSLRDLPSSREFRDADATSLGDAGYFEH